MSSYVIGCHFGHDASIAIVGGKTFLHLEKERFSKKKHDSGDIRFLFDIALEQEGISVDEIVAVIGTSTGDHFNSSRSIPHWDSPMQIDQDSTSYFGPKLPLYYIPHHTCHAAYAFYCSPFDGAEVLAIDGCGDNLKGRRTDHAVGTIFHAIGSSEPHWDIEQPDSLGLGSQWDAISAKLFGHWTQAGTVMALVGVPEAEFSTLTGFDMSVKLFVEELQKKTTEQFCSFFSGHYPAVLSGGCALNGIANYAVLEKCKQMRVPPSAGDGGLSVGAALFGLHYILREPRVAYDPPTVMYAGSHGGFPEPNLDDLNEMAYDLALGKIIPFAYGKAESGPRALGHRSFLGDPRSLAVRDRLNILKGRQPYRPTAPVVLEGYAEEYFDLIDPLAYDYMTVIAKAKHKAGVEIPAALHYDGSARVQIAQPGYLSMLLRRFHKITGVPALLNTSLNLKGVPLINSTEDMGPIWGALGNQQL